MSWIYMREANVTDPNAGRQLTVEAFGNKPFRVQPKAQRSLIVKSRLPREA
jgi:hypothetical protein